MTQHTARAGPWRSVTLGRVASDRTQPNRTTTLRRRSVSRPVPSFLSLLRACEAPRSEYCHTVTCAAGKGKAHRSPCFCRSLFLGVSHPFLASFSLCFQSLCSPVPPTRQEFTVFTWSVFG